MDQVPVNSGPWDALVLDFGGVLFDIAYDAPVAAFAALGFDDFGTFFRQSDQSHWVDDLETGAVAPSDFLKALQAHCHPGTSIASVLEAWNSILIGFPPERLTWVQKLSQQTRLFLFSNTNVLHARAFEAMLAEQGLLLPFQACFEAIHYSHEWGQRKPNRAAFKAMARQHRLQPVRTLFVDDSPQHVAGAQSAGWQALHLPVPEKTLDEALRSMGFRL
jgi:putative hydrolase of the HAD superfamily